MEWMVVCTEDHNIEEHSDFNGGGGCMSMLFDFEKYLEGL